MAGSEQTHCGRTSDQVKLTFISMRMSMPTHGDSFVPNAEDNADLKGTAFLNWRHHSCHDPCLWLPLTFDLVIGFVPGPVYQESDPCVRRWFLPFFSVKYTDTWPGISRFHSPPANKCQRRPIQMALPSVDGTGQHLSQWNEKTRIWVRMRGGCPSLPGTTSVESVDECKEAHRKNV